MKKVTKKFIGVFLTLCLLSGIALAGSTYIGIETIMNRCFDSTNNALQATVSGVVSPDSPFTVTDSNVIEIDINTNIETAIAAATAGDTIVLASGTYTITDDIDIAKAINIVGQGIGKTTIACATANKNIFNPSVSNVRISNLSISATGANNLAIFAIGTDNITGIVLENLDITVSASGANYGIRTDNGSMTIKNVRGNITSSDGACYGIYARSTGAVSSQIDVDVYDSDFTCSGTGTTVASYLVFENEAVPDIYLTLYNCIGTMTGATSHGLVANGGDAFAISYNSTFSGATYDVANLNTAGTLTLYDTTLVNGTTSGTITYGGTVVSKQASLYRNEGTPSNYMLKLYDDNASNSTYQSLYIRQDGSIQGALIEGYNTAYGAGIVKIDSDYIQTGTQLLVDSNSADASARSQVSIVNDNTAAVGTTPLTIQQDAPISTNFKKYITLDGNTIWVSDGTTAEGALTGVQGDICLNGGTGDGQMAYCDSSGTNWTDM